MSTLSGFILPYVVVQYIVTKFGFPTEVVLYSAYKVGSLNSFYLERCVIIIIQSNVEVQDFSRLGFRCTNILFK